MADVYQVTVYRGEEVAWQSYYHQGRYKLASDAALAALKTIRTIHGDFRLEVKTVPSAESLGLHPIG